MNERKAAWFICKQYDIALTTKGKIECSQKLGAFSSLLGSWVPFRLGRHSRFVNKLVSLFWLKTTPLARRLPLAFQCNKKRLLRFWTRSIEAQFCLRFHSEKALEILYRTQIIPENQNPVPPKSTCRIRKNGKRGTLCLKYLLYEKSWSPKKHILKYTCIVVSFLHLIFSFTWCNETK